MSSFVAPCIFRSAADWGPAKDYLRESIAIAEALNDTVAVADRQGDLGTVYRSEGRTADALQYQQKHYQFAKMRGKFRGRGRVSFSELSLQSLKL